MDRRTPSHKCRPLAGAKWDAPNAERARAEHLAEIADREHAAYFDNLKPVVETADDRERERHAHDAEIRAGYRA